MVIMLIILSLALIAACFAVFYLWSRFVPLQKKEMERIEKVGKYREEYLSESSPLQEILTDDDGDRWYMFKSPLDMKAIGLLVQK